MRPPSLRPQLHTTSLLYPHTLTRLRTNSPLPHHLPPPTQHRNRNLSTTLSPTPLLQATDIPAPHIGSIRILTLSSPHNSNALSLSLLPLLSHEITALSRGGDGSRGGVRALVIASALDNVFCAGADLKERRAMSDATYSSPPPHSPPRYR